MSSLCLSNNLVNASLSLQLSPSNRLVYVRSCFCSTSATTEQVQDRASFVVGTRFDSSVTRLGYLSKRLGHIYFTKVALTLFDFFGLIWKTSLFKKKPVVVIFRTAFAKCWDTFYSSIRSHCSTAAVAAREEEEGNIVCVPLSRSRCFLSCALLEPTIRHAYPSSAPGFAFLLFGAHGPVSAATKNKKEEEVLRTSRLATKNTHSLSRSKTLLLFLNRRRM